MARNVKKTDDINEIRFHDPIGGTEVLFFHRDITTEDRVRHTTRKFVRKDGKLVMRFHSACIESAAAVLTGIRDGDFLYGDEPLSSTPGNPGYREDWKQLIEEMAGDLLLLMGHALFEPRMDPEALKQLETVGEFETAADSPLPDPETPEELLPLPKSSGEAGTAAPRSEERNA